MSALRSVGFGLALVVAVLVAGCRSETPQPRLSIKDDPVYVAAPVKAPAKVASDSKPKEKSGAGKAEQPAASKASLASDPSWVYFGEQRPGVIGFTKHTYAAPANAGPSRRIRLFVGDRPITLRQIRIVFANGQDQIVDVAKLVPGGLIQPGTAYEAEIAGAPREVKAIELEYRSRIFAATPRVWATVSVFAQK